MYSLMEERIVQCPYCGEYIDLQIDTTAGNQMYVEECHVCCQPILMDVAIMDNGMAAVSAMRENE
jgi:hypothetical protein